MSFFRNLFSRKKKVSWDQIVSPLVTIPSNIRVNPAFAQHKQWKKDMQTFNRVMGYRTGMTEYATSLALDHPEAAHQYIAGGDTTKDFIAFAAAERAVNNPDLAQQYINAGLTTPELISLQESAYRGKQEIYNQISQEIIQGFPGTGNISFRDLNPSFVNKTMQECLLDYEDMLEICELANISRGQSAFSGK